MANGPGLSWGAGVADARPPAELTDDAFPMATAQGAPHSSCNVHNPEASAKGSGPEVPVTQLEASGGAIASELEQTGGSTRAAPAGRSAAAHRVRFAETGSNDSAPALGLAAEAAKAFPAQPAVGSPPQGSGSAASVPPGASSGASHDGNGNECLRATEAAGEEAEVGGNSSVRGVGEERGGGAGSGIGSGGGITGATTWRSGSGRGRKAGSVTAHTSGLPGIAAAASGGSGSSSGGAGPPALSLEPSSSMVEHVSREVIRKLRLAASAGSAEDRHVVCEELFADITCALDASAQAALLGPAAEAPDASAERQGGGGGGGGGEFTAVAACSVIAAAGGDRGGGGGAGCIASSGAAGRRGSVRGQLYYEVLALHYASRAAADSACAVLHLCQLLWDTPWVAPTYALLLHRFLLLPREPGHIATSPTAAAPAATAASSSGGGGSGGASGNKPSYGMSYSDPLVKHLNVLAHGARQLLLGDVHSGLSRFQPLWAVLAFEVAGLGLLPAAAAAAAGAGLGGPTVSAAPMPLPPVTSIDAVPVAARPWLLAVAAAFLPYYCLDEQVSELARRFPPPLPLEGGGGSGGGGAAAAAASLAGFDFLVVEVTDVLGRINSEAGLLKYLGALRALARPPTPTPMAPGVQATAAPTAHGAAEADAAAEAAASGAAAGRRRAAAAGKSAAGGEGAGASPPPPEPPLAGLPTITKLRLQNELYSLTSGGGPRYAPPEVRRAAFAALDALFPGGRSLRRLVRWASRTLHLEWLEGDGGGGEGGAAGAEDPWPGRGWVGWIYWPIHWYTALYGKILLAVFQLIYGMVIWRPWRRGGCVEVASVAGTGGAITAGGTGGGGGGERADGVTGLNRRGAAAFSGRGAAGGATAGLCATGVPGAAPVRGGAGGGGSGAEPVRQETGPVAAGEGRGRAAPWWQPRLRG